MPILTPADLEKLADDVTVFSFWNDHEDVSARGFLYRLHTDSTGTFYICSAGIKWRFAEICTHATYPRPDYRWGPKHAPSFCMIALYTSEVEESPEATGNVDWERDDIQAWRYTGLVNGYCYPWKEGDNK